jgi:hypothetical protein
MYCPKMFHGMKGNRLLLAKYVFSTQIIVTVLSISYHKLLPLERVYPESVEFSLLSKSSSFNTRSTDNASNYLTLTPYRLSPVKFPSYKYLIGYYSNTINQCVNLFKFYV